MSQPDRFVAIDFAPPAPTGRRRLVVAGAVVAVLLIAVVVVGVTQLLLR